MNMLLKTEVLDIGLDSDIPGSVLIKFDRSKMFSHAKPAIAELLLKLHIFRATANVTEGMALYEELSRVDERMYSLQQLIVAMGRPRKQFVQANTFIEGEDVVLREYEASAAGIVQSWAERGV